MWTCPKCGTLFYKRMEHHCHKHVGSVIADVLSSIGIPKCGGCQRREMKMNAAQEWLENVFRGQHERKQQR